MLTKLPDKSRFVSNRAAIGIEEIRASISVESEEKKPTSSTANMPMTKGSNEAQNEGPSHTNTNKQHNFVRASCPKQQDPLSQCPTKNTHHCQKNQTRKSKRYSSQRYWASYMQKQSRVISPTTTIAHNHAKM